MHLMFCNSPTCPKVFLCNLCVNIREQTHTYLFAGLHKIRWAADTSWVHMADCPLRHTCWPCSACPLCSTGGCTRCLLADSTGCFPGTHTPRRISACRMGSCQAARICSACTPRACRSSSPRTRACRVGSSSCRQSSGTPLHTRAQHLHSCCGLRRTIWVQNLHQIKISHTWKQVKLSSGAVDSKSSGLRPAKYVTFDDSNFASQVSVAAVGLRELCLRVRKPFPPGNQRLSVYSLVILGAERSHNVSTSAPGTLGAKFGKTLETNMPSSACW